jgi:hypothetical protein
MVFVHQVIKDNFQRFPQRIALGFDLFQFSAASL